MSLFTAREWWSARSDSDGEEYDIGSLVVANLDNVDGSDDIVVTGSLGGVRKRSPSALVQISRLERLASSV